MQSVCTSKKAQIFGTLQVRSIHFYVNTLPRRFARLHLYKPQDFWSNLLWTVMVWTAFGFFCIMVFLLFLSESHWECCTSFSIAPTSTSESSLLGRPSCTWYLLTFLHLTGSVSAVSFAIPVFCMHSVNHSQQVNKCFKLAPSLLSLNLEANLCRNMTWTKWRYLDIMLSATFQSFQINQSSSVSHFREK